MYLIDYDMLIKMIVWYLRNIMFERRKHILHMPYKGQKPYIFISYSHKDSDIVFEIIKRLQSSKYRVWYDEGIDSGTEWDENIASHIDDCGYFVAFISNNYLVSSNCKDELNYARDLEKPKLLVYLEDVLLPGGMRMRLSRIQAIHKYKYSTDERFFQKLLETKELCCCREEWDNEKGIMKLLI